MVYEIDALSSLKPCHMQGDDRSLQGPVAEPALHGLYVLSGLQEVSGIAVAEHIQTFGYAALSKPFQYPNLFRFVLQISSIILKRFGYYIRHSKSYWSPHRAKSLLSCPFHFFDSFASFSSSSVASAFDSCSVVMSIYPIVVCIWACPIKRDIWTIFIPSSSQ